MTGATPALPRYRGSHGSGCQRHMHRAGEPDTCTCGIEGWGARLQREAAAAERARLAPERLARALDDARDWLTAEAPLGDFPTTAEWHHALSTWLQHGPVRVRAILAALDAER